MTRAFEEHWLSAYLDNELSADERAQVEERLEEDPAARELLEDLKRVRGLVATLPRWQGKDFHFDPAALAAIESRETQANIQSSSTPSDVTKEDGGLSGAGQVNAQTDPSPTTYTRRSIATQGYYWSGLLTLAAGITLLFMAGPYLHRQGSNRELARAPDSPAPPNNAPDRFFKANEAGREDRSLAPGTAGQLPASGSAASADSNRGLNLSFGSSDDPKPGNDEGRTLRAGPRPSLEMDATPSAPRPPAEAFRSDAATPPGETNSDMLAAQRPGSPAGGGFGGSGRVGALSTEAVGDPGRALAESANPQPGSNQQRHDKVEPDVSSVASAVNAPAAAPAPRMEPPSRNAGQAAAAPSEEPLLAADFRYRTETEAKVSTPTLSANFVSAYSKVWEPSEVEVALKQITSRLSEEMLGLQNSTDSQRSDKVQVSPGGAIKDADATSKAAVLSNQPQPLSPTKPREDQRAGVAPKYADRENALPKNETATLFARATDSSEADGTEIVVGSLPVNLSPEAWLGRIKETQPLQTVLPPLSASEQSKQRANARGALPVAPKENATEDQTRDVPKDLILFVSRAEAARLLQLLRGEEDTVAAKAMKAKSRDKNDDYLQEQVRSRAGDQTGDQASDRPGASPRDVQAETRDSQKAANDKLILILRAGE